MFSRQEQTLEHTFTERIDDKTNQNKRNRRTQTKRKVQKIHPTPLLMEVLIKNHSTFSNYRTVGKGKVSCNSSLPVPPTLRTFSH